MLKELALGGRLSAYILGVIMLANAFIFPSLIIYLGNIDHFTYPLISSLQFGLGLSIAIYLVIFLVVRSCSTRCHKILALLFATLSLLLWMQSNVLVWDFGVLDGTTISWKERQFELWVDISAWLSVAIAALVLLKFRKGNLIVQGAYLLFVAQFLTIAIGLLKQPASLLEKSSTYSAKTFERIANFSEKQNVLHIVVDAFQADVFEDLIYSGERSDFYKKSFDGFTYYREAMGVFPRTKYSVPAFLAGKMYDNATKHGYIESVFENSTILSTAQENEFEIDIVADGSYQISQYRLLPHQSILDLNDMPQIGGKLQESAQLLDLALFRVLPGPLKKMVYNNQKWTVLPILMGDSEFLMFEYFTNAVFLSQFFESMTANREAPVYKYMHLFSTHGPKVVTPECRYAGEVLLHHRDTYTFMAGCTLNSLADIFNKMKQLGIYNNALILLHADHGGWVYNKRRPAVESDIGYRVPSENFNRLLPVTIRSAASPLLALKLPNASGGVVTSNSYASLLDVPDTVSDAMNWGKQFGHQSLLTLPENQSRKRVFRYYNREADSEANDHTGPMADFIIDGSHYESDWRLHQILLPRETP